MTKDTLESLLAEFAPERREKNLKAAESVRRLINSHFGNAEQARTNIPVDLENDDDIVASRYVKRSVETEAKAALFDELVWCVEHPSHTSAADAILQKARRIQAVLGGE